MGRSLVFAACLILASLGLWFGLRAKREAPYDAARGGGHAAGKYKNFRVSIYVVVSSTRRFADPVTRDQEFARVSSQLKFDKVYLEVYRNRLFATDEAIESAKQFFESRGIEVSGGVTLAAGGQGGQFGTFDYEKPEDRAECKRAVELAASHFDEVILDDFFFYTSKSDADIAAKGARSWTQYRLETMRDAAANLVLKPARAVRPNITMIIKYPNWYEHFQGLGYDLDKEAQMFDAIYTGTETRDPYVTDQLLQQYEGYEIFRYFSNIRPGHNLGGWVDTYSVRYVDRYAEELWLTLFAKAQEITLFNWADMAGTKAVEPGDRKPWEDDKTSFRWSEMVESYSSAGKDAPGPGWARAAGYSLEQVDVVIGKLGKPIGVASYKPYQSSGEDFLHDYLGNMGLPIELTSNFPDDANTILLSESAKFDPDIIAKIQHHLKAGGNVVITSGFLQAMQSKGIEDIVEWQATGRKVLVHDFISGFGAGNGTSLNDPKRDNPAILFPEIHFFTNDSWPIVRGVAGAKGFPMMLMNRYSNAIVYLLTVPENIGDLYNLPRPLTTRIKTYLQPDFPVRIDSPAPMSLFAYDNKTFIVESFLAEGADVSISVAGVDAKVRNIVTGEMLTADPPPLSPKTPEEAKRRTGESPRTSFSVKVEAHSYQAYQIVP
jgi:hypothetical protein